MFSTWNIHEQIKFPILLIIFMIKIDYIMAIMRRQITIGQYFFPRTASFSDYGWDANVHSLAEPVYDDVFISQNDEFQQQQKKHNERKYHGNMTLRDKSTLFPIPTRILHKNRFNALRPIGIDESSLIRTDKKMKKYVIADATNTTFITITEGGALGDVHVEINNNNSDIIRATVINDVPNTIKNQNGRQQFDGHTKRVIIDITNSNNTEAIKTDFQKLQKYFKFHEFLNNQHENISLLRMFDKQRTIKNFLSNTEILNQILEIRNHIEGIKRDIKNIRELLRQNIGTKMSYSDQNPEIHETNGAVADGHIDDRNYPSRQLLPDHSFKLHAQSNIPAEKSNDFYPSNYSRLRANAEAPELKEENLTIKFNETVRQLKNTTMFIVSTTQGVFLDNKHSWTKSNKEEESFKISLSKNVQRKTNKNDYPLTNSDDMIKLNSTVRYIDSRDKSGKFPGKETLIDKKATNDVMAISSQLPTSSSPLYEFFVTAPPLKNEKESPIISVTQIYRQFSSVRYTAPSMIKFDKSFRKLITFTSTPKPLIRSYQLQEPVTVKHITANFSPVQITVRSQFINSPVTNVMPSPSSVFKNYYFINSTAIPLRLERSGVSRVGSKIDNVMQQSRPVRLPLTIHARTVDTTTVVTTITTTATTITTTIKAKTITDSVVLNSVPKIVKNSGRQNGTTLPPLIAMKPYIFGNIYNGMFVPWFHTNPQLNLWPKRLLRRK